MQTLAARCDTRPAHCAQLVCAHLVLRWPLWVASLPLSYHVCPCVCVVCTVGVCHSTGAWSARIFPCAPSPGVALSLFATGLLHVCVYNVTMRVCVHTCVCVTVDPQVRGPPKKQAYNADGTPSKALEGFCRKNNVSPTDVTVSADNKGVEYVFATVKDGGQPAAEVSLAVDKHTQTHTQAAYGTQSVP